MINIKCVCQRLPFVDNNEKASSETNNNLSTFNLKLDIKLKSFHFILVMLLISYPELVPILLDPNLLSSH